MENGRVYKYGQLLVSKEAMQVETAISGEKVTIPAGNKVVIGFDGLAHHLRTGRIQPLAKNTQLAGFSSIGVVEAIFIYLNTWLPLEEMLEEYDVAKSEFKENLKEALEEIGMTDQGGKSYGKTGN